MSPQAIIKNLKRSHIVIFMTGLVAALLFGVLGTSHLARNAHAADKKVDVEPVVHDGSKIKIPESSPYRKRLVVAAVGGDSHPHKIETPASVDVDPAKMANILPPLTGRLLEVRVKPGDVVRAGQVLAVIASPDLAQAYSDVEKARDAEKLALRALDRARGVHEAGANAAKDFEAAESAYSQAQSESKRAQARLKTLDSNSETNGKQRPLTVAAPINGIVTTINVGVGSYINDATAALMSISNLDKVWITANVPEQYVSTIAKGQDVEVLLSAYPGQVLHGKVSIVSPIMEPDTRRNKVRIVFDNADGKLKPNMYATVRFAVPLGDQISVPTSALLMNNDNTTVFVEVAPWTFERRSVELGIEEDDSVRILSGLKPNERIVVRGGVLLND